MALTEDQISKLVKSWNFILGESPDTGVIFYNRLFTIAPEFNVLFTTSTHGMAEKFMNTISVVLTKAYKGNSLIADIQHLAFRHVTYGVLPSHYSIVGKALIEALEYGMGDKWNDELNFLWATLYSDLSNAMIMISNQSKNNKVA